MDRRCCLHHAGTGPAFIMKNLAIILAAAVLLPAHAESAWHLQAHAVSHHFNERTGGREWNENNIGLGLRREFSPQWSVQAGAYRNSIDRWSTYAVADWTPVRAGPFSAGVFAGLRANYTKPVQPAAGAVVRWHGEQASVTLRLSPKVSNTGSAMVAIELGWKL